MLKTCGSLIPAAGVRKEGVHTRDLRRHHWLDQDCGPKHELLVDGKRVWREEGRRGGDVYLGVRMRLDL